MKTLDILDAQIENSRDLSYRKLPENFLIQKKMLSNKRRHNTTKLGPNAVQELKINQRRILIDSLEIGIPAPKQMIALGERQLPSGVKVGQLLNSKTLNYKKFTPHRDGLFCERIFGPVQSFVCACGKKKESIQGKNKQKEILNTDAMGRIEGTDWLQKQSLFCPKCQVEYTSKEVRRHRLGYIKLFAPVTHIWYLKGRPSYLSLFLGKRKKAMTSLAYCNAFLVEQVYSDFKLETQNVLKNVNKSTTDLLEKSNIKREKKYHVNNLNKKQALHKFDKGNTLDAQAKAPPLLYKQSGGCKKEAGLTKAVPLSAPLPFCKALYAEKRSKSKENQAFFGKALLAPDWYQIQKTLTTQARFSNCDKNSFFSLLIKLFPETYVQTSIFTNSNIKPIEHKSFKKEGQKRKPSNKKPQFFSISSVTLPLLSLNKTKTTQNLARQASLTKHNKERYDFFQNSTAFTESCYIRAQALPFLPSLISPFHLRDHLISFLQSTPCKEDVPIPLYCQTPRRYPLRDVHKFITEFRSREFTKKVEKLTSESITKLTGLSKQEKPFIRSYPKNFYKKKAGVKQIQGAFTKAELWFANVLDVHTKDKQALYINKTKFFYTKLKDKQSKGRVKNPASFLQGFARPLLGSYRALNNNFKLCFVPPFELINTFTKFKVTTFALPKINDLFDNTLKKREQNKAFLYSLTNKQKFTIFPSTKAKREAVKSLPCFFRYQYKGETHYANKALFYSFYPSFVASKMSEQTGADKGKAFVRTNFVCATGGARGRASRALSSMIFCLKQNILLGYRKDRKFISLYLPTLLYFSKARLNIEQRDLFKTKWYTTQAQIKRVNSIFVATQAKLVRNKQGYAQTLFVRRINLFGQNQALSNFLFDIQAKNSKKTLNCPLDKGKVYYRLHFQDYYKNLFNSNLFSFSIKKENKTYQARLLYMVFGTVNKNINLDQLTQPEFNSLFKCLRERPFLNNRDISLQVPVFLLQDLVNVTNQTQKLDKSLNSYKQYNACFVQANQSFGYVQAKPMQAFLKNSFLQNKKEMALDKQSRLQKAPPRFGNPRLVFTTPNLLRTKHNTTLFSLKITQQEKVVTLSSRLFSNFIKAIKLGNILTVSLSISLPFIVLGSKQNRVVFITKKERKTEWIIKKSDLNLFEPFIAQTQTLASFFIYLRKQQKLLSKAELALTPQYPGFVFKSISKTPESITKNTDQRSFNCFSNKARSSRKSSYFISSSFPDTNVFSCILFKSFKISEERIFKHHNLTKSIKLYKTCINQVQKNKNNGRIEQKNLDSVIGIRDFFKNSIDQPFTKMWLEQKHANLLATRSYTMFLKGFVLNKTSLYSLTKVSELKYNQVKAFSDTEYLPKESQTSSGSEMISKWHLNGAKEILLYTGGGALESLLKRFDVSLFYEFLFGEIQILRRYYKNQMLFIADYNKNQTLERQDYTQSGGAKSTPRSIFNVYERRPHFVKAAIKAEMQSPFDIGKKKQKSTKSFAAYKTSKLSSSTPLFYLDYQDYHLKTDLIKRAALQQNKGLLISEKSTNSLCRRIYRSTRRLKIVQLLMRSQRRPEWMMISILPVLPPDLRPVLQMGENLIVASDLNTLYQRVIYRNNRHYKAKFLDFHFVSSIHRLVQDAVDRLIENGKGGSTPFLTPGGRPLKSLSDILKGKRGRFRFNLLGKRVDFSGRSVIVVSPNLKIHECGLPREMALELYKYLLIRQLLLKKRVSSIVNAKKVIKQRKPFIWDMLREIIYYHPLLLNRAPTLHRLGIQAFQPKLTLGNAILLHPLVCAGFNADFDGDQMGVHLPLSPQARAEAWDLLWSRNSILSPATGQPILLPSQDMVLGFYYMTALLPSGTRFTLRDENQQLTSERMMTKQSFDKSSYFFSKNGSIANNKGKARVVKSSINKQTGVCKNEGLTKPSTSTSFLQAEELLTYVFSDTSQIVHAYQNKKIDIHTPIWLKWAGKFENGKKYQIPLELRLNTFAYKTQIYPTYNYKSRIYKDKNTVFLNFNKNNTVAINIRTTVGRVLVNNLISRH